MDMLLLGETITAPATGQNNYGAWMSAGGNDGVAGAEVFYLSNLPFTLHMETKSSDQADSSAISIGNVSLSAAGNFKCDVTNALDLVRYRVTSTGSSTIHLQFAQPLWQPN